MFTDLIDNAEGIAIDGFGMRANIISTGIGYRINKITGFLHHQMHIDFQIGMRTDLLNKERGERNILDVVSIHNIDMQKVGSGI